MSLQLVTGADTLPKVTALVPCVEPKLDSVIVTVVPPNPEVGERFVTTGPALAIAGASARTIENTIVLLNSQRVRDMDLFPPTP